jgi:hypothetical protein
MLLGCSLLAIGLVTPARADTNVIYTGNAFNVSVSESSSLLLLGTGLLAVLGAWRRRRLLHRIDVRRLFISVRRRLGIL